MPKGRAMKRLLSFMGFLTAVIAFDDASADLFRCTAVDGKVVFTDREDACPGAAPHTLEAEIQKFVSTPAAVAPEVPNAVSPQAASDTQANSGVWREKKISTQQELGALEEKWCNKINSLLRRCWKVKSRPNNQNALLG